MAANTLAISGQKRTADHFDSARKRFHNFGGDDWLEKFKAYGVPVSPKVFFDKEDETVGKDKLDMKRTKMCNRLWGLPISHSVHSKVGWESQDSMLTFQRLIAVGTTSLIAMATEDPPIIVSFSGYPLSPDLTRLTGNSVEDCQGNFTVIMERFRGRQNATRSAHSPTSFGAPERQRNYHKVIQIPTFSRSGKTQTVHGICILRCVGLLIHPYASC